MRAHTSGCDVSKLRKTMDLCFPFRICLNGKLLDSVEDATPDDAALLRKVDNFTLTLVTSSPKLIIEGEVYDEEYLKTAEVDLG